MGIPQLTHGHTLNPAVPIATNGQPHKLHPMESLRNGWRLAYKTPPGNTVWAGTGIIVALIAAILVLMPSLTARTENPLQMGVTWMLISAVISALLGFFIAYGGAHMAIRTYDDAHPRIRDIWTLPNMGRIAATYLLYIVITYIIGGVPLVMTIQDIHKAQSQLETMHYDAATGQMIGAPEYNTSLALITTIAQIIIAIFVLFMIMLPFVTVDNGLSTFTAMKQSARETLKNFGWALLFLMIMMVLGAVFGIVSTVIPQWLPPLLIFVAIAVLWPPVMLAMVDMHRVITGGRINRPLTEHP